MSRLRPRQPLMGGSALPSVQVPHSPWRAAPGYCMHCFYEHGCLHPISHVQATLLLATDKSCCDVSQLNSTSTCCCSCRIGILGSAASDSLHQQACSHLAVQWFSLSSQKQQHQASVPCYSKLELYARCRPSIMVQQGSRGQLPLSWVTSTELHQLSACSWRRQMPAPSSTASCPCQS